MKRIVFEFVPNEINEVLYDLEGKKFRPIIIDFDFEGKRITLDEKRTLKVERNDEFVYCFMKTKIKAINGIDGLYKHIQEAAEPGDFWNNRMYKVLAKAVGGA